MLIDVKGLTKNFGALLAVKNVDLQVNQGEILGLVGPNGAGKTTLLKMLATLLEPASGLIQIMGHDSFSDRLEIRQRIGYLPDFFNLYDDLKLWELLYFFAHTYGVAESERDEKINQALKDTELFFKRDDFIKNLSRGMTQRLGLAVLLVHEPDIFLLDEPASGLDPKARITLRNILKRLAQKGKTLIVSSHILTELDDFCSHIAIMNKGELMLHEKVEVIQRRLKGRHALQITVLNSFEKAKKIIQEFEDVDVISENAGEFIIEHSGGKELIADINKALVEKAVLVVNLVETKKNLEDVFMHLTQELELGI